MNTLRQAFELFKSERGRKGTTLQRRLVLFFVSVTVFLILVFVLLLLLFGITGKDEKAVNTYFDNELSHISQAVYDDFAGLSLSGIAMSEKISETSDAFLQAQGIASSMLPANPALIEPLLAANMQTLLNTMNSNPCGGVFIVLDATVRPFDADAAVRKAGVFIKRTLPTTSPAMGAKTHYLRGPAQIARDNGIELLGQWSMEYDISEEPFFTDVMQRARHNSTLAVSRLYYWTGRVTLKGNSEAGFLLCVPLRSRDGAVFGVCGIEVSERMFKQLYSPTQSDYRNVFAIAAPAGEGMLYASHGMTAGNYYLTGSRMNTHLAYEGNESGFLTFTCADSYGGKSTPLRIYPSGSVYEGERWAVAVMMPAELLATAVKGSSHNLIIIVCILLALSLSVSILISRRYISPVTRAIDLIRTSSYTVRSNTPYVEIADLFDFLARKERENDVQKQLLTEQSEAAMADAENAAARLSRLADKKQREVDPDSYELFTQNLTRLTPRERQIFDLYLEGYRAKDIMEHIGINENTMKYHNRNIYSKLGVVSRKELLLFATLMTYDRKKDEKQ